MHPRMPARSEDWNLALPVHLQEGSPAVDRARRRARRIVAGIAALVIVLLTPIAAILWREAQVTECVDVGMREGFRGSLSAEWSSWPPGWECVFETRDGSVTTRYIGF